MPCVDVYDARIGGGFPSAETEPACSGESCQGSPVAAAGTEAAAELAARGGREPPPQRERNLAFTVIHARAIDEAQKLAKALKACKERSRRRSEPRAKRRPGRNTAARPRPRRRPRKKQAGGESDAARCPRGLAGRRWRCLLLAVLAPWRTGLSRAPALAAPTWGITMTHANPYGLTGGLVSRAESDKP